MLVHRAPDGLRRCREKMGQCPYGGPMGQTLSRNRSGENSNDRQGGEKELPFNAKGLPLVSIGTGKFIRRGVSKSRELSTKFATKDTVGITAIPNGGASASQRGGTVMTVMRENNNSVSEVFEGLSSIATTRRYIANGFLEFNGKTVGSPARPHEQAKIWDDEVALKNKFKCRVHKSGKLYATINIDEMEYSLPVGDVSPSDLSNGRFLARLDKVHTQLKSRKRSLTREQQVEFFKKAFAEGEEVKGRRRPSAGVPSKFDGRLDEIGDGEQIPGGRTRVATPAVMEDTSYTSVKTEKSTESIQEIDEDFENESDDDDYNESDYDAFDSDFIADVMRQF